MDEHDWLASQFEEFRPHLRSVAYRMLGSLTEAEDAVQDAWLRVSRAGADNVDNLGGWLTTIVARVCLNQLRSRTARPEELRDVHVPDPVLRLTDDREQPEDEAVLADSVGLALLVVLDTLSPSERLAFVLHDMFDLPFDEIGPMVDRTPAAARQLASRARRRVRGTESAAAGAARAPGAAEPERDRRRQREIVTAFFSAARDGDFDALVTLLDPEVVLRMDGGTKYPRASAVIHGAEGVAQQARRGLRSLLRLEYLDIRPAIVNDAEGVVVYLHGQPATLIGFTIVNGRIAEMDAIADPERVARLVAAAAERG